jgi:hypothetical protein
MAQLNGRCRSYLQRLSRECPDATGGAVGLRPGPKIKVRTLGISKRSGRARASIKGHNLLSAKQLDEGREPTLRAGSHAGPLIH